MITICRSFITFILLICGYAQNTSAFTDYQDCNVSSDVEFFDLTAHPIEPVPVWMKEFLRSTRRDKSLP